MFEIVSGDDGSLKLRGRLDAAQVDLVTATFGALSAPRVLDCSDLNYISSAGLGLLFATHKRLLPLGGLKLANLNPHIRELFKIASFDQIFQID